MILGAGVLGGRYSKKYSGGNYHVGKNGEMNGILVCGINRGESERGTEIS